MNFLDAMTKRHACKSFDSHRKITAADQSLILEFGRISPSSFGIEPWHFLVINDVSLREKLRPACWNQPQITEASFIVIFLSYLPYHFRGDTAFLRQRLWRRSQTEERYQGFLNRVVTFLAEQNTFEWAKRQTYLALSNMMTGAASLNIDSCPIEGYTSESVKEVLKPYVDWLRFDLSALCAFGYRAGEQTPRIREPLEQVCTLV